MKAMQTKRATFTIRPFHPVDGPFYLIMKDSTMIAKTWTPQDAQDIVRALALAEKVPA